LVGGRKADSDRSSTYIIRRPRLTQMMDDAAARVRLLTAPAGYGKTTLAREWLGLSNRDGAWMTATPALADVASFTLAFRHALRRRLPNVGAGLEEQLRIGPRSDSNIRPLARHIAEGLANWPLDLWLVVDDYHVIMAVPAVEQFLDELLVSSSAQVILASRCRPTWASARRLIYGDVHEIGQSTLAMNYQEASEVLAVARRRDASGLLALANGWPAIIGLAANAKRLGIPAHDVPAALYDFFAQELYQAAAPSVRRALVSLALAPSITVPLAVHVTGDNARNALAEGERLGFVQRDGDDLYVMHSLVRDFLKKQTPEVAASTAIVDRLVRYLLDHRDYDDLFVLCREFPLHRATRSATDKVLQMLLTSDQVSTIERWITHALAARLDSAAVDLAQAELEFREGRNAQAAELAMRSSARFPTTSPLVSRALFRAGMAAYHENRPRQARDRYQLAREAATTTDERLQALWGELNVILETNEDPSDLLCAFETEAGDSAAHQLRLGNARLMAAYRCGGIAEAVRHAEALLPLVDRVDDPMVVSAFLHALAHSSVLAGKYDDALLLIKRQLDLIRKTRLNFVLPHVLITRASASAGRRNFGEAKRNLTQAEHLGRDANDRFILSNAAVTRIQILLAQGSSDRGYGAAASTAVESSLPALRGELLATRALAAAAVGRVDDAETARSQAAALARSAEAREFCAWAECVQKLDVGDPTDRVLARFEECVKSGCVHAFVCAYRAAPSILGILARRDGVRSDLQSIVLRARDEILARRAGLNVPLTPVADLSQRESEVFALLGEGLMNAEIASRLFISEVTVKVYVRRIFQKTGARTRAEAAVAAASYLSNSP
jgi:DNA-binding CsgD family transcriptional regulator/tetratricopeptide (TPR) repeat protein